MKRLDCREEGDLKALLFLVLKLRAPQIILVCAAAQGVVLAVLAVCPSAPLDGAPAMVPLLPQAAAALPEVHSGERRFLKHGFIHDCSRNTGRPNTGHPSGLLESIKATGTKHQ